MVSAGEIKVYSFLNITRVADFCMEIKGGEHGRVTLRGYLDGPSSIGRLLEEPVWITIQEDAGGEELLFCGIIQDTHIFYENGVSQVILTALTNDIKMDREEKSRSYQNKTDTYLKLMKHAVADTEGEVRCSLPAVQTGYPVIRYRETDWEFCRRMASNLGLAIYGDPLSQHPVITAGLPEKGGGLTFSASQYRACVDEAYYHFKGAGKSRREFLYYEIESGENHEIGESAHYQGQKRYIFEKRAELVDGMLAFRYKLGGKCRFEQGKYGNRKIAGTSLRGKVAKREGQTVYLELEIDGADARGKHPYPWAPVTGSLMYCMPGEGTEVSLYFPDTDERNAYAVSTAHGNASCPGFADVQKRGLTTEHGKKIEMYPDRLGFLGGTKGDEKKCRLGKEAFGVGAGSGKLQITGKEKVELRAPAIRLSAAQKIGQYTMESLASEKELYPRGSRNPATGSGGEGAGIDMSGGGYNALSAQGIVAGTEYEFYVPFDDAPEYEAYEEIPAWMKAMAGFAVAALIGFAVGALVFCTGGFGLVAAGGMAAAALGMAAGGLTAGAGMAAVLATEASDRKNGTESSVWEYMSNAFTASAKVGGSLLLIMAAPYAAEAMVYGTIGPYFSINMLGTIVTSGTLVSLTSGAMGIITLANTAFQLNDVTMFAAGQKEMGALTGNAAYDNLKQTTEVLSFNIGMFALMNPRLHGDMKSWFSKPKEQPAVPVTSGNVGSGGGKGGSRQGYSVDPSMFPDDEAAGVLRNGEYVKNPTAHNINDYISEGSNYLGSKQMNGQYMYVVDMDGNIVIGTRGGQRMPHPTLVGGNNPQVQAAGMLEIRGGKIYSINNASGHFKPSNECLGVAEAVFGSLPQNIFSKDFQGYLPYGQ